MAGERMIPASQAFNAIVEFSAGAPVVFSTGYTSRRAAAVADRPNHFYMLGSMGLASAIGLGIAQARGGQTWVVDGAPAS